VPGRSNGLLDRTPPTIRLKHNGRHAFQSFGIVTRSARELSGDHDGVSVATLQDSRALRVQTSASEGAGHTARDVSVQQDEGNAGDILVTVAVRILCLTMLSPQTPEFTVAGMIENAEAGAFVAYGVDRVDLFRRAAGFVDKILRGAKPADLATKLVLVINLKTGKAIGLTVSPSFLARADRVIE
jgi:ABC transporter substrate binding protein